MRASLETSDSSTWAPSFKSGFADALASLSNLSFVGICARIAFLFLAATALIHVLLVEESGDLIGFGTFIDVDAEANLPTWFASFIAQAAAVVAFAIGESDRPAHRLWWRGIAAMLFLMGIDEIASIHNTPSRRLGEVVGVHGGWLMNAWILPALLLCAGVAIFYARFLLKIPRWMAFGFIGAAALYITGAIGLEVIGSRVEYLAAGFNYDGREFYSLKFELIGVAEEAFEYAGILLTLGILIRRARELNANLTLKLGKPTTKTERAHEPDQPLVWTPETEALSRRESRHCADFHANR